MTRRGGKRRRGRKRREPPPTTSATTSLAGELDSSAGVVKRRNPWVIKLLFETPSGFAIFSFDPDYLKKENAIEDTWTSFVDGYRHRFIVWLKEFQKFEDKSIAINLATETIDVRLTKMLKRWCVTEEKLVVGRPEYKRIIERNLGITCLYDDVVREVMWGLKNLMHVVVPEEKSELSKEDRLHMSQGLDMLLRRYDFDVKPEMVNERIVQAAYDVHRIDLREKEHLKDLHILDKYFMKISGIDSKNWSAVKLATALMMMCYPEKIEYGNPIKMFTLHDYSKILDDAAQYQHLVIKDNLVQGYKDIVYLRKEKFKNLFELKYLVKAAKEMLEAEEVPAGEEIIRGDDGAIGKDVCI